MATPPKRVILAATLTLLCIGFLGLRASTARGDAVSDGALKIAIKRGEVLFRKQWRKGAKTCATCHASGRNRMTAARLKSYPKYDKSWKRVITGQQKLNVMLKTKVGGTPLSLGSADLNALEAYISQIR